MLPQVLTWQALELGVAALLAALPQGSLGWRGSVEAAVETLERAVVSPTVAEVCHALDAAMYVWTVNDVKRVRDPVETDTGGIISGDPRLLPRTLRQ